MMTEHRKLVLESIVNMDELDKLTLYMDYYIRQICLKYNYAEWDVDGENVKKFLWANSPIMSFKEYTDPSKNFFETDRGEDWKENHWAERYTLTCTGLFRDIYVHMRTSK
jgi:hypothetical protein